MTYSAFYFLTALRISLTLSVVIADGYIDSRRGGQTLLGPFPLDFDPNVNPLKLRYL